MKSGLTLLGVAELAGELGVKPRTVAGYLARGFVPEPAARLACGPVWTAEQVEGLLAGRRAKLEAAEREYDQAVADVMDRDRVPEAWRRGEQARRNARNAKMRRRGRPDLCAPTLTGELREHAEREVVRRLEEDPGMARLAGRMRRADGMRGRLDGRAPAGSIFADL